MGKELLIAKDLKQYFPIGKDRFVRAVDGVNFSSMKERLWDW